MTPEEARAVMEITGHPKWGAFQSLYNARLTRTQSSLETADDKNFRTEQGKISEIRYLLGIRKKAEAVLNSQTR